MHNKHKRARSIIAILCTVIVLLYAIAIPIGAVVNSSQVPEGSTALYGQSTFPYSVGFVCSDANLDSNYVFATEIGTYGLNNNQTIFGEDQFEWHYPDSTDTETSLIEYSGVDQIFLRNSLRWYANRSTDYGSNYGYTYGGFGQMNLEYYTNTQDFVDNVESIIFKASDVFYNTVWLTHQDAINTFSYLVNPTPIEFMMPTVMLPDLVDYTTKAFVGAYSVECSILDDRGNSHYISYSLPIDTREEVPRIPFIVYSALKDYINLTDDGRINDDASCKTLLITEYRGYLDVDYYENIGGTWSIVPDSREMNKVTVTFPMYDTSESQGIPPYASTLLSYPSATKFAQSYEANLNPDIPQNTDLTGWIGTAVGGFLDFELFEGFSLGGLLSILIGFSFVMLFLKFFAGG